VGSNLKQRKNRSDWQQRAGGCRSSFSNTRGASQARLLRSEACAFMQEISMIVSKDRQLVPAAQRESHRAAATGAIEPVVIVAGVAPVHSSAAEFAGKAFEVRSRKRARWMRVPRGSQSSATSGREQGVPSVDCHATGDDLTKPYPTFGIEAVTGLATCSSSVGTLVDVARVAASLAELASRQGVSDDLRTLCLDLSFCNSSGAVRLQRQLLRESR
jgi:hypothetical protein